MLLTFCATQDSGRQLTRPCASCPTQLILITPRDGPRRTVLPRVNSSAGWAATRDAVSQAAPQSLQRTVQRPGCRQLSSSSWRISSRRPLGRGQLAIRPRSRGISRCPVSAAAAALLSRDWPLALSSGGYERGPPGVTIAGMEPPTAKHLAGQAMDVYVGRPGLIKTSG